MKNPTKSNIKKKAMLEALKKSLGVVTSACIEVNIDRTTHYQWLKEDDNYKKQVEDIENIAIDFVESKLFKNIKNEDVASILFFLKTKGRKRGYVEKQELDMTSNGNALSTSLQIEIIDKREQIENTDNENIQQD
jgi:hypothetical protein